ncbi:hypothetical protein [Desulfosoma caldarium]|uniref:Uncharacterized protein n=1 Tax=Desulfosoma caldarium TaxID=610254 RepID=A0A3N1UXX5_9BACT|nr:hypothetical protein [Desulfosoma caldarium]ROQ93530.1 hypothetical protein EDC27_1553 [Desulfosoma caldarium]
MENHDILVRMDALETRCPKLGHQVPFGYCRKESGALPCSKALVCWSHRLPVELVLRKFLGDEAYEAVFNGTPKSRIQVLLEAIEAAKERCGTASDRP